MNSLVLMLMLSDAGFGAPSRSPARNVRHSAEPTVIGATDRGLTGALPGAERPPFGRTDRHRRARRSACPLFGPERAPGVGTETASRHQGSGTDAERESDDHHRGHDGRRDEGQHLQGPTLTGVGDCRGREGLLRLGHVIVPPGIAVCRWIRGV